MKYLIFGNGWLGNKFANYFGRDDAYLADERIRDIRRIRAWLKIHHPDFVINCIGKTGRPNIDWCEDNKEATFFSNVTVPQMMAEECERVGTYMVHLGSGCVYQTKHSMMHIPMDAFTEDDAPNFIDSYYSKTKVFAESILSRYKNVLIARLRMPFDDVPDERNLINKLTKYKRVLGDVPNSMTYVPDLLAAVEALSKERKTGIYNICNEGAMRHRQLLTMYKEIVDPKFELPEFITLEELSKITKAPRSNCVLSTKKLDAVIKLQDVKSAMSTAMHTMRLVR